LPTPDLDTGENKEHEKSQLPWLYLEEGDRQYTNKKWKPLWGKTKENKKDELNGHGGEEENLSLLC
jgi:hypothetical protein